MKNELTCTYSGNRDEAIVEYLYGALDSAAGADFERHLARCGVCIDEVRALGGVRKVLAEWTPPEPIRALEHQRGAGPRAAAPAPARWPGVRGLPAWARVAAAMVCLGVGLGAANLRLTYGAQGLSLQTGWLQPTASAEASTPAADAAPWRAELTALQEQLRREMTQARSTPAAATNEVGGSSAGVAPAADPDRDALVRQVRALIGQSEQRQQRELAIRIGDLSNDVQAQRRADLSRIERSIGLVQNSTGMEVLRQREMLNSLAVRVSQRP
jgi:hypothetical protein